MSTLKDARTLLLESYLNAVIDDDEFIVLYDGTFSKNSEIPYEFFLFLFCYICNNDIKIQDYRNTLNSCSMPLQCFSCRFQFHVLFFLFPICFSVLSRDWGCSNLELSFCRLWNKQLQFSSCFQRPLASSFLVKGAKDITAGYGLTTMISRYNISSWRELHTIGFLKVRNHFKRESLVKNETGFQMSEW